MSQQTPERKKTKSDAKPLTWDRIVAKLIIRGLSREQIGQLTIYQAIMALDELGEEMLWQAKVGGAEIKGEEDHEATLQDLMGLSMN